MRRSMRRQRFGPLGLSIAIDKVNQPTFGGSSPLTQSSSTSTNDSVDGTSSVKIMKFRRPYPDVHGGTGRNTAKMQLPPPTSCPIAHIGVVASRCVVLLIACRQIPRARSSPKGGPTPSVTR